MASRLLELTATVAREIWDGGRAAGLPLVCKGHSRRINFQGFGTLYTSILKACFLTYDLIWKAFGSESRKQREIGYLKAFFMRALYYSWCFRQRTLGSHSRLAQSHLHIGIGKEEMRVASPERKDTVGFKLQKAGFWFWSLGNLHAQMRPSLLALVKKIHEWQIKIRRVELHT